MPKKYTRKQLKQPDEFITFSIRAWSFIQKFALQVTVMAVVAIFIIAAAWIWTYFAESKAQKTTTALIRAVDIYNQTVIPMETKVPETTEDGLPRFKTRTDKLAATVKEFSAITKKHSGDLAQYALLLRGGVHYDQGKYTEAIADFNGFLKENDNPRLRDIAMENLAYCYEATKSLDKALDQFRKLSGEGDKQYIAMYHEARILALQGKKKKAIQIYKQILDKAGTIPIAEKAGKRLSLLESK